MRSSALAATTVSDRLRQRVADYVALTKPRIALMALVTEAVGFCAASSGPLEIPLFVDTLLGTALVAAGASMLNQVLERDTDVLMRRTQNRPLSAGRLSVSEAVLWGFALSLAGVNYLCLRVGPLTGLLGAITLGLYVFVYTPLKRCTTLNTAVGAIAGALPPVMGWTAVRGSLAIEAGVLFLILFLWQFPHFLAIAWIYRDDYLRAGLRMLPVLDEHGGMTGRQIVGYSLALLPASLGPTMVGLAGPAYFFAALLLGITFLAFAIAFAVSASHASARNLMRASLAYLPTLLVIMVLDLM